MPEEHTYNQVPGIKPETQENVTPEATNQVGHSAYPQANIPEQKKPAENHKPEVFSNFSDGNSKSSAPSVLVWLAFVIVLVLTGYFWLMDFSNVKSITEKEGEKNQIAAQLGSENNKAAQEQAQSFSTAFSDLNNLVSNSMPKSTLLTELYTHFTKDIKVTTLSLSKDGGLSVSASTASYRQVADFMLGLKGYSKISNVVLKSVSLSTEDGVPANQKITFSISSDIQTTKEVAKTETGTEGSATSQSTSTNAEDSASTATPSTTGPASTNP